MVELFFLPTRFTPDTTTRFEFFLDFFAFVLLLRVEGSRWSRWDERSSHALILR